MNTRIKEIRLAAHLTQEEFANRICITKSSVSLLESGKNNPSDQTIKLICSEFGIRREWLETGAEPMYPEQVDDGPHALVPDLVEALSDHPAVLAALRRVVRIMTPADWDRLNEIIDAVMEEQEKNTPEA